MRRSSSPATALPPLFTTSLQIPRLHEGLITRALLANRMDLALQFPVTLICAPAGFGKTTLLSQWISGSAKLQNRVAWVSLERESDLHGFWTYMITALEGIRSGIGASALTLLEPAQPPIHTLLRILINEISAVTDDLVLILDDYHYVDDPGIQSGLAYFIDHLPSNLHLVISSRAQPALPLARWRVGNQLYELREDDLRFTYTEVAAFFNEKRGMNLSPDEIAALEHRTEGWIAGLQLVALSIQGFDQRAKWSFISAFTGSQRYILDYLIDEVLQRQPENIKTFLLQTSVLERLNASLCNAVTGHLDAQAILETLERAGMFTIPLDQERNWYRYHHLFQEVLGHELQRLLPGISAELHRRAAAWYSRAGQLEDAIRHACSAHDWDQAIELIEMVLGPIWNRGEIRKVMTLLGRLPDKYLDARVPLALYYSRALMLGGQMEAAEKRLRDSEQTLRARLDEHSSMEDRLHLGTICAFRTTIAAVAGDMEGALALGGESLRLLPAENIDIRAHAINSLGGTHYYLGNMVEADRACTEAVRLARQAGNFYLVMVAASYRARALVCQGHLKQAGQVLEQALRQGSFGTQPVQSRVPAASVACAIFGNLLYEWNHLEEAERFLNEAIELGEQLAYGSALWSAFLGLARIKLAHGDRQGAEYLIERAQRYRRAFSVPLPVRAMDAEQACADLAMGRLESADLWAQICSSDRPPSPGFIHEFEQMTLARLYLLQDQPGRALAVLDQIYPAANANGHNGHVIEILMLTALARTALGEPKLAINTLRSALERAETEGYVRTFVDAGQPMAALLRQALAQRIAPEYVRRLLGSFSSDVTHSAATSDSKAGAAASELIEPLSERELEVLQLMAGGATNQDIAQTLVIAFTTAKKHVSNVIRKLGVANRMQAVARGRELGLLD